MYVTCLRLFYMHERILVDVLHTLCAPLLIAPLLMNDHCVAVVVDSSEPSLPIHSSGSHSHVSSSPLTATYMSGKRRFSILKRPYSHTT